ncbi:carbonic anhydrase 4-like [Eublepharis macularius]|uniref:Carbonic anhydrase n=1 Tax=Eublepharis macularius TaxID=481883 RepID=A0AA97LBF6_EUBMA|nr:carbonic anhydrase 4-like [Eublepharis macularius]
MGTWKPALHILLLLLLGGSYVTCEEWCYDKPSCGPHTWYSLGQCSGAYQSPINIETRKALPGTHLGPLNFIGYENRMLPKSLTNTGHYAEVEMRSGAAIFGKGLPATYYLKSFHFHWGKHNKPGSEHAVDGKRYDIELHIVHTKNNMSSEEARKDPEGFAVLGFFLQGDNGASKIDAWKTLADRLELIPEKGDSVLLAGEFSMGGLLSKAVVNNYFRYRGSLTTPDCNESVIWTVFPEPISITHKVVKKFIDSLYFTTKAEGRRMQDNFRPVQPIKKQKVFYFEESKHSNDLTSSGRFGKQGGTVASNH